MSGSALLLALSAAIGRRSRRRGLLFSWVLFAISAAGLAFPHLAATSFNDDARVVRLIAAPLLVVSAFLLADFYLLGGQGDDLLVRAFSW